MHDSFTKHEVAFVASFIAGLVDDQLIQHRAVKANPYWRKIAEELFSSAIDLHKMVSTEVMAQKDLYDLIRTKSFRKGDYVLATGHRSHYYFDMKPAMLDPCGINLLADAMLDHLNAHTECDAIAGVEMGGVPLVTVMSAKSYMRNDSIPMLIVRKKNKDGAQLIEGDPIVGARVVVIDDVSSSGQSLIDAVEVLENFGCTVEHVITVIDRLEGAADHLQGLAIKLSSLFTRADFDDH